MKAGIVFLAMMASAAGWTADAAGGRGRPPLPAAAGRGVLDAPNAAAEIPLVTVCRVREGVVFEVAAFAQGTVRAKESATIAARVPGTIDDLLVAEGDVVKKGAPLFRVDRANLENAAKLAEISNEKAQLDFVRLSRLVKDGAVTRDAFEKAEVGAKSAALQLAVAQKNLADSEVKAPFDGIVTEKKKDVGDFVSPGAPVLKMDNAAAYEIRFALNSSDYGKVKVGETRVRLDGADGGAAADGYPVTYKSPSVNPATRTFEIRIAVPKTDDLAPGMIRDATVVFSRRVSDALPASAVNPIDGTNCLAAVRGGRLVRLPVAAGVEQNGLRAVSGVAADERIVEKAMLLFNEGDEVRVAGEGAERDAKDRRDEKEGRDVRDVSGGRDKRDGREVRDVSGGGDGSRKGE